MGRHALIAPNRLVLRTWAGQRRSRGALLGGVLLGHRFISCRIFSWFLTDRHVAVAARGRVGVMDLTGPY